MLVFSTTHTLRSLEPAQPGKLSKKTSAASVAPPLQNLFRSKTREPIIPLIFPVSSRFVVCHDELIDPLCAFVAELGGNRNAHGCAVTEGEGLAVRFITQERLRMNRAGHVVGREVRIRALDVDVLCVEICTDALEEAPERGSSPFHVDTPALDAAMFRIHHFCWKRHDLRKRVFARIFDEPAYVELPIGDVHLRFIGVIAIEAES